MDKTEAQARVDRIRAFQSELAALQDQHVLKLPDTDRDAVQTFHDQLLRRLAADYDVDVSQGQRQLSLGMRLASLFGALALSAAVFFFFHRFWGGLGTSLQVGVLIAAPLLATLAMDCAARRERTLYFASLIGVVAFACFVLDLSVLGRIFNITPSQHAFLAWAAFALLLAYAYRLRLLLVAGLTSLIAWLSATVGTWSGLYWLSFGERPENMILAGIAVFALGWREQPGFPRFSGIFRVYGLLTAFLAILMLANWGSQSYLRWSVELIEDVYQASGFILAGLTIWLGIKRHWTGLVNLGVTFGVLFLYTKLFDWWWDWMPKYLFFLLLGLIAMLLLVILRRLRSTGAQS